MHDNQLNDETNTYNAKSVQIKRCQTPIMYL